MNTALPPEAAESLAEANSRRTESRLASFDPAALACLALPPVWTARAALAAFPTANDKPNELAQFLDAAAQAGLLEAAPDFLRSNWEIFIHESSATPSPLNLLRSGPAELPTELFSESGLMRQTDSAADKLPNAKRVAVSGELKVPIRDTLLRATGLRFPVRQLLRPNQAVQIECRRAGETSPVAVLNALTLGGGGNNWEGWAAAVGFTGQQSGEPNFLLNRLYSEFRVRESRRAELLAYAQRRLSNVQPPMPLSYLCGRIIQNLQQIESPLPEALDRWCRLVKWFSEGTVQGDRQLTRELKHLLEDGQTGPATAWITVAESVAPVFGGEVPAIVRLGRRRIELAARRGVDQRHLKSFFRRDEQVTPFHELLEPNSPVWALHYVGGGGVGKTMLLRHLITDVLPTRPEGPLPFARVDFDELNADYPLRRPAQLLLELAGGLRGFGEEGTESRSELMFREFRAVAESCHTELEERLRGVPDPRPVLDSQSFRSVVAYFCDFLSLFPAPAVFILDTCEELARLHGEAGLRPAVEATFKIFEMVRKQAQNNKLPQPPRIVFAGRRLLAVAGAGWRAAGDTGSLRAGVLGESRDYLRVVVLRGFDATEAHTFLTDPKYKGPTDAARTPMTRELETAVLRKSPEALASDKVEFTSPETGRVGDPASSTERYNPFDLALYADWFNDDPGLTKEVLERGGSDPYVRNRVVKRIRRDDVLAALPFLAELRRVECLLAPGQPPLLQQALQFSDAEFDELRRELCQLEWVDYHSQAHASGERVFLTVDRNLLPRFRRFLAGDEWRQRRDAAQATLEPLLVEHMKSPELSNLEASYLSAATRLVPPDLMAEQWMKIEQRIAEESAWGWAVNVCHDILADAEEIRELVENLPAGDVTMSIYRETPKVLAHINATLAAATLHTEPLADLRQLWNQLLLRQMAVLPSTTTPTDRWLSYRATLGAIAAEARQNVEPSETVMQALAQVLDFLIPRTPEFFSQFQRLQLQASVVATLEALFEMAERLERARWLSGHEAIIERWLDETRAGAGLDLMMNALFWQFRRLKMVYGPMPKPTPSVRTRA